MEKIETYVRNAAVVPTIRRRKSRRKFLPQAIAPESVKVILTAGTMAPSGKNGQPWRFAIVQHNKELLKKISALTAYNGFVCKADCLIAVCLDKAASYHYVKDVQAIGACIENMLLQAEALGIGSCWIGEILNKADMVSRLLGIETERYELMAVIALGYSDDKVPQPRKKEIKDVMLFSD